MYGILKSDMLGTLRRYEKPLGRFLAVFLLSLQVFTQLGHYQEHRPSAATAHHARHHSAAPHRDFTTPTHQHACALCTVASSSAVATLPLATVAPTLLLRRTSKLSLPRVLLLSRSLHDAPSRAPPVS
ncbi:DUF2946 family protein [Armatimonas sp.]|uniref:DUF2946 family protein n=1 Tax=Armatimonas sp. TaxID=1872638 RepID=UPI003750A157